MKHTSTALEVGAAAAAALLAVGVLDLTGNAVAARDPAPDRDDKVLRLGVVSPAPDLAGPWVRSWRETRAPERPDSGNEEPQDSTTARAPGH